MTPPRIGLLYPAPDPLDPQNWSGSPFGLASGLAEIGAVVVPIGTPTGGPGKAWLGWGRLVAGSGPEAARSRRAVEARTRALAWSVRAAGPLDAMISMMGDVYRLAGVRPTAPTATYDDATLVQQWRNPSSDIRGAGYDESAVTGWFATESGSARAADICCVSTSWAARSFVEDYEVPAGQVHVVGMGHRPRTAEPTAVRDWSRPRFLLVGIDWTRKNGDAVVRAFRTVREQHRDAQLDLVGGHPRVDEPGVVGHGLLRRDDPEAQRELDDLYRRATAFVMPSRFDPSPIAYLEAASAGLPVVATTEGGAAELLGEAAITVDPGDEAAILAAMLELADEQQARTRGQEARLRAATASWPRVAQRVVTALLGDSALS